MIPYIFGEAYRNCKSLVNIGSSPIFIPKKHIVESTAQQKRKSKKRKNKRNK
jgi:hypothetical protein